MWVSHYDFNHDASSEEVVTVIMNVQSIKIFSPLFISAFINILSSILFYFTFIFLRQSLFIAQASLKFVILLPQPSEC